MSLPTLTAAEISYELRHRWDTRQEWLYASLTIPLILATTAVLLRVYARRMRGISLAWNDYLVIIALVLGYGMVIAIYIAIHFGLGMHVVVIGKRNAFQAAKMLYVAEVLFPPAGSCARLSVLLLYYTIFGDRSRWFIISLQTLGGLWVGLGLAGFFCTLLQCIPISLAWRSNHAVQCLDLERMIFSMTMISIFLNFGVLLLPMPLIWKLQMTLRRKLAIGVLFIMGGGDVVINILRAITTHEVSTTLVDFTWLQCTSIMLCTLELMLAIICVCIPTLRPIFIKISNRISQSARKARIGESAWTVPFVMLKTTTQGTGWLPGQRRFTLTSNYDPELDEEKLIDSSLPSYSRLSAPPKNPGTFTTLKSSLLGKPTTSQNWPTNQNSAVRDENQDDFDISPGHRVPTQPHKTEALIAQSLVSSGYEKAFHPPASPQFQPRFLAEDPVPTATPANSRKTSRSVRQTLRSMLIGLDTRDEVVRAPSHGKRRKIDVQTSDSSATLLNSPRISSRAKTPVNDAPSVLSRSSTKKSGKRKPGIAVSDAPLLLPSRYQPPAPKQKASVTPTSSRSTRSKNSSQKRKGPHYVKSPFSDPDEKVRIGSPREVHIRRPSRGQSIKEPSRRPSLKQSQSFRNLDDEPAVPKIAPSVPPKSSHSPALAPTNNGVSMQHHATHSPRPSNLPPLNTSVSDLSLRHRMEPHYQREYTISPTNELRVSNEAAMSDGDMSPASAIPSPLKSRQSSKDELTSEKARVSNKRGLSRERLVGVRERISPLQERQIEEEEYAQSEKNKEIEMRNQERERWYIDPVGGPRKKPHAPAYQTAPVGQEPPKQQSYQSHNQIDSHPVQPAYPRLDGQAASQGKARRNVDDGRERGWERQRRKDLERAQREKEREEAEQAGKARVRDWIQGEKYEKPLPPLPPKGRGRDSDVWI